MCGIAGHVLRGVAADREVADRQVATLRHRGPDAAGVHIAGPVALGQSRLSIIDLVDGDPPIQTPDGAVGVALNGEIYNFLEHRERLLRDGHDFRSHGDTEVIAHLAERYEGGALARQLEGMFAFAVHNAVTGVTTLARDRMGQKPLYYYLDDSTLVFGSEIKAVLAHPAVPRRLDEASIPALLTLGAAGAPYTMFKGIRQLLPGHAMTVAPDFTVDIAPYWELKVPGVHDVVSLDLSFEESVDLVERQLEDAVRRRLVADVPLGAFLSGGIDSSVIVAMMSRHTREPVRTFTIGFDDASFDERRYAQAVAKHLGTDHEEQVVHANAVDLIARLVHHHDEPFGDSSAIPTFLLSEMTRKHVTVALSGDGGDELYGGYERFAAGVVADYMHRVPESVVRGLTHTAAVSLDAVGRPGAGRVARFLRGAGRTHPAGYLGWISYTQSDDVLALAGRTDAPGLDRYAQVWGSSRGAGALNRLLHLNALTYLPDDLLPKVDRTSMAHGLEVRSPFLDTALVETAFRLPATHKVRGKELKRVLRAVARRLVPAEVIDRPKQGFGIPLDRWMREDLKEYVDDRLCGPASRVRGHLSPDAIDAIVLAHRTGESRGHALWTLLTFEEFLRKEDW